MKKILVCLLVLVLALTCFAACGKKGDDADTGEDTTTTAAEATPVGYYVVKSIDGIYADSPAVLESFDVSSAEEILTVDLQENGVVTLAFCGLVLDSKWNQSGNKITFKAVDDFVEATWNEDELSFKLDDTMYVLVKQSNPSTPATSMQGSTVPSYQESAQGLYVIKSINGVRIDNADFLESIGVSSAEEMMMVNLKADGTAWMTVDGDSTTCTWAQYGDSIIITVEGESMEATLNGDNLTLDFDGDSCVLVKQ